MRRIALSLLLSSITIATASLEDVKEEEFQSLPLFTKWPKEQEINSFYSPQNYRRYRRRLSTATDYAVQYQGYGIHFLHLYFGNPTQGRTLAVNTNGPFTALPCDDCTDCGIRPTIFNTTASSTFSAVDCDHCSKGYSSCFPGTTRCVTGKSRKDLSAWSGYEVQDVAFHGGGSAFEASLVGTDAAVQFGFMMRFMCQTRTRGYFNQVQDGVISLSPASTSFINQMYENQKLARKQFALCFHNKVYNVENEETGRVTFGGVNLGTLNTEMVYARKLPGDEYKINIVRMHLRLRGGDSIRPLNNDQEVMMIEWPQDYKSCEVIVDSGYPFMTFDKRLEIPFRLAWKAATGKDFTQARQTLSLLELQELPTILLELEADHNSVHELDPDTVPGLTHQYNVLVAISAEHYIEKVSTNSKPYRNRIQFDGEGGLLGANMMQGHTISYEMDKERIGFAESKSCNPSRTGRNIGGGGAVPLGSGVVGVDAVGSGDDVPADEPPGTIGISTSSGSASSQNTPQIETSMQAAAVGPNDDIFLTNTPKDEPLEPEDDYAGGACETVTCRCIMAIGYVFVGTALAVAYRVSRPKDRTADFFHEFENHDALDDEALSLTDEHDINAYRRHTFQASSGMVV